MDNAKNHPPASERIRICRPCLLAVHDPLSGYLLGLSLLDASTSDEECEHAANSLVQTLGGATAAAQLDCTQLEVFILRR
jgi:hypothetical protein